MSQHGYPRYNHRMIEAVLFDIGDTLIYFETSRPSVLLDAGARPAHERLVELGLSPPPFPRYAGKLKRAFVWAYLWSRLRRRETDLVGTFGRCHAAMGITLDNETLVDLARRSTTALRAYMKSDAQALDMLQSLRESGVKLGIVSNTHFPSFAIDGFLAEEGMLDFFPIRIYSSEVRFMKPNPKIFKLALEELGIPADHVLFVGDRADNDIRGAARVGMRTALFVQNGRKRAPRCKPDHVIHNLNELPAIVAVQG